jgi:hypothetical protein
MLNKQSSRVILEIGYRGASFVLALKCRYQQYQIEEIKITGVDESASIRNRDVLVKPTWKCLRRLAGLSAR